MNIGIIPLKYTSKRFPKKNFVKLFGKPIFLHIYEEAIKSKLFKKVVISTDSQKIINICKKNKISDYLLRPKRLSGTNSTLDQVIEYTINAEKNIKIKNFCMLWATAAMTNSQDIVKSYNLMNKYKNSESCIGCKEDYSLYSTLEKKNNSFFYRPYYINKKISKLTKQSIEPNYLINSSLAWVKLSAFNTQKTWIPKNTLPYVMPYYKSVDVDYYRDFELLEYYFKKYR